MYQKRVRRTQYAPFEREYYFLIKKAYKKKLIYKINFKFNDTARKK